MNRQLFARLAAMDAAEWRWRGAAAARNAFDRARFAVHPPRWKREALASRLIPSLRDCRALIRDGRFDAAHLELSRHFAQSRPRFVIGPQVRAAVVERIQSTCPDARREAVARADRLLFGTYDLLGYEGLRFDASGSFGWNEDPVHDRRAPGGFWSSIRYLEPSCGDHKIIWELNRHQHWIALGRAYWLTGDGKYRGRCLAELESWLQANPPLEGINWASMLELALRSLSWLWALNFFVDPNASDRQPWIVDLLLGIERQLTQVERNLSRYFSPNTHLLGEALALYVAGRALPELAASEQRASIGRAILLAEATRQIGADGGHSERSAHYHRYALDFYLLAAVVARLTHDPASGLLERTAARLAAAARLLADESGRLPHIGDDDGGMLLPIAGRDPFDVRDSLASAAALLGRGDLAVCAPPEETLWLLANPLFTSHDTSQTQNPQSLPSGALAETGYYVSRSAHTQAVIDGGPHGYQNGGHAHADALSLTLTVDGAPLLIDPGTATYTMDRACRDRFRSSALHNTVTIDGRSPSTPSGPFHWARTTDARVDRWRVNAAFDYFEGFHGGYDGIVHRRHVLAVHGNLLVICDLVEGGGVHDAAAHWHVDPRWTARIVDRRVELSSARRITLFATSETVELLDADAASGLGFYSPAYGRVEKATTVRVTHRGSAPFWMATVFDLGTAQDVVSVDAVPIWAEARTLARSFGLRISRPGSTDYVAIAEPTDGACGRRWRVAEFETDARMLFVRTSDERQVAGLALVDGSVVSGAGRHGLRVALPAVTPDLYLDLTKNAGLRDGPADARVIVYNREREPRSH